MPSVLIADDNALSLVFLREAVCGLGLHAVGAGDGSEALQLARQRRFDLLLLDLSMPGLGGLEVLRRLRTEPSAASHGTAAIATSAELDPARRLELLQAGFCACMGKPLALADLRRLLQRHLGEAAAAMTPEPALARGVLDDAAGLQACGDPTVLRALRGLFAQELDALPAELAPLLTQAETAALRDRLHRLRASCGFCGAAELDAACAAARSSLEGDASARTAALQHLLSVAAATRARLPDPPG